MKKWKLITTKATALSIAAILAVTGFQDLEKQSYRSQMWSVQFHRWYIHLMWWRWCQHLKLLQFLWFFRQCSGRHFWQWSPESVGWIQRSSSRQRWWMYRRQRCFFRSSFRIRYWISSEDFRAHFEVRSCVWQGQNYLEQPPALDIL